MAATSDESFREIQLNGKQLVFLGMASTVVLVVIFLCGVLVGRGVRAQRAAGDPLSASAEPSAGAPEPAVAVSTPTTNGPAGNEQLSYPGRLASNDPTPERLKQPAPPASKPTPPAAVPAVKETTAPGASAEPAGDGFAIQVTALGKRTEADGIARTLTDKGYPAYVVAPDANAPPVFRVRVGKFKERREAEAIASRLQKEGQFKPWIVR
jgi:cell division septation protein DedD